MGTKGEDAPTTPAGGFGTAVVTGASGGIGCAVALALAQARSYLWLLGRTERRVAKVYKTAASVTAVEKAVLDFRSHGEITKAAHRIRSAWPVLNLLVHCAGVYDSRAIRDLRGEDYDAVFDVNVRARIELTRELLPSLQQAGGMVVFTNSSVALRTPAGPGVYGVSMHALRAATDSLREEVNSLGVRVLTLFLGRTATPMQQRIHAEEGVPYRPELLIQPQTVAQIVLQAARLTRDTEMTDVVLRPLLPPARRATDR